MTIEQDADCRESKICNCDVVVRADENEPYLFAFSEDSKATVRLDGYLICPKDMFTERQRKMAYNRYRARFNQVA